MFDRMVLRRSEDGSPISQGKLAEAILYYQNVHVVFDAGTLQALIRSIGTDLILTLLKRGGVSGVYCDEMLGTNTEGSAATQCHNFVAFTLSGDSNGKSFRSAADRIEHNMRNDGITGKKAKNFIKNFLDIVPVRTFSSNYYSKGGIIDAATADLQDSNYIQSAARSVIETAAGGYEPGANFRFEILKSEIGHFVFTNADFTAINRIRARMSPPQDPITPAHILSSFLDARADLILASFYGGDFATSDSTSAIIQLKHSELLRRMEINHSERHQFTEIVLSDAPALAEVIDAGERTFEEFLKLLDQSRRFKEWLHKTNPDEHLVSKYLKDVTKEGWIESTKAKVIRYMLTTGMDAINPVAGIVAGLSDTFVIDKLFKGWRPNHFIEKQLAPFVKY
ncbi:hypothetical protein [Duganella sp. S19_KUP01_CR8]|uniref:hypothetical protein n=1 Tax=Duganella sp. S19_KUP01_CR8 TaxID=3025502 RepID=UPI002FCD9175